MDWYWIADRWIFMMLFVCNSKTLTRGQVKVRDKLEAERRGRSNIEQGLLAFCMLAARDRLLYVFLHAFSHAS